jgi:PAS domain-containing protein
VTIPGVEPLLDDAGALRERKRALDRIAVATPLLVLVAVAVPWFLQALPLDLGPAARAALAFTLSFWAAASASDRLRGPRALLAATLVLQAAALLFLAFYWHLLGGLQTPTLLLAFLFPALAGGLLLRPWQALALAGLSVLAVGSVAMAESPELRWYVSRLGLPGALQRLVPALPARAQPFPGTASAPAFQFVLIEAFAVLELAIAAGLPALSGVLRRLLTRPAAPGRADADVLRAAFLAAPVPTALLETEDGRILLASEGFSRRMLLQPEGRVLFEALRFSDPGAVRELLRGGGGTLPLCSYAIGAETRVARLEAQRVSHSGWSYTLLRIEDLTELSFLHTAVAEMAEPVLVLGADARLRYANRAAETLFGELFLGLDAATGLSRAGLPEAWWNRDGPGQLEIDGARYALRSFPVSLEEQPLRLLSLVREAEPR